MNDSINPVDIKKMYAGNFIYQKIGSNPEEFEFFSHPEGYVTQDGLGNYEYVYQYKDHLGNVRLSYSDADGNGSIDASSEIITTNNYYPFGLQHKGYNNYASANANDIAEKFKYNGKQLNDEFNINWYDFGARNYDAALGRWMNVDPLADERQWLSPYNYVQNKPLNRIDPDGALDEAVQKPDDWVERTDAKGNKSIVWDAKVTSATDKDLQKGDTYLGKAVVVMDGSAGENLDANGKLTGKGASSAKTTIYGPGGANDIQIYDGLTITSDTKFFTPIASGDYEGYHQQMSSAPFAKGSLTYRIKQLNGSHKIPTKGGALNKDPNSKNFGTPWKTEIFFHRTNNSGFAGARSQNVAVSKGCPVISAPQWKGVEKQLGKISSFRLRIIR